ncbi:MAG: NapC/NirT family cytochrome c [Ignavibacteriae bacterium]|nr:NapC/NirT family cytochrome c [Ignavibacteriota bacterium]MCB9209194.1 NapC/NirT family cytochrome c [Ignavibacteriales bacterium]MCB9219556.1 NapC/NirT family cytochrome c [Ignavibacteriales bacterium]MCB9257842.1 NapC/NirT family cytochrome c [Ignavibacteriales bacterium]
MKLKLPSSAYNWISLSGAVIAIISLFMIIFLFAISYFLDRGGSYLGLVIYIILPAFLIGGLILIPIGMIKNFNKEKSEIKKLPYIDLNQIAHRNAFMIFITGTIVFLFISALGSYEAFHYTESTEFCGTLCHSVMQPEYVAYQNSAHAKVRCVECHVGTGADWYVKSKLSGLYQVYAVLANVYPKPIETPISNLRPARETCEECHWPEKFYSRKLKLEKHFLPDDQNTEWDISLIMKIGPSDDAKGLTEGIHWHINPNVKIEFVSLDDKEQEIPWVKYTNKKTGEEKVYIDENLNFEENMLDTLHIRTMDCIDCHNRPSHIYNPPAFFVNNALSRGDIPNELPEIKSLSMEICDEEFNTTDSALTYIEVKVKEFYFDNYPEIADTNLELIDKAILGLQEEYKKNIFPEMKVRWDAYPNNIGHLEFNGCFRCHSDTHLTNDGDTISKDCNMCHEINAQGPSNNLQTASFNESLEFVHPEDIDEMWKEGLCTECHTGLNP